MKNDFVKVEVIKAKNNNNGKLIKETVYERYKDKYQTSLHEYGKGPFCRFSISTRWNYKKGVYAFVIDNRPVYIGETVNLGSLINNGVGRISPSACYVKGQETFCRINSLILDGIINNKVITLVFYETDERSALKSKLINEYKPIWNKTK